MPSRGSGLAVAAARTTLSPILTTAEPPACLANFPVSNESCLPPARSTVTLLASGFMFCPCSLNQEGKCAGNVAAMRDRVRYGIGIRLRDCARCELAQCCTGFKEGGFLSYTVTGNIFFRDRSKEDRSKEDQKGGRFIVSHFSPKTREIGHPRFRDYLRMPSLPMTVL